MSKKAEPESSMGGRHPYLEINIIYLTQPMTKATIPTEKSQVKSQNVIRNSITQRLWTYLGWSV